MTVNTSQNAFLVKSKSGRPSLKAICEDGTCRAVHSLYDPEAEAGAIVNNFSFDGKGILVVLGLGLGYHLAELSQKFPDAEILVVEVHKEIYELAMEHGPVLDEKIRYLIGLPYDELMRTISECQMKDGISPLSVFTFSPALSISPAYYTPVLQAIKNIRSVRLWDRLKHAKFSGPERRILMIDSEYFLIREVERAILSLGHKVLTVPVRDDAEGGALISGFVSAILDFQPDFILTINHLGFDEHGVLTSFFKSIEMPVASWYVDSPRLIVGRSDKNKSPYVSIFSWDSEYMDQLMKEGFESVDYLPLAADEGIFRPVKSERGMRNAYRTDVSFVGNSLVDKTREKIENLSDALQSIVEKRASRLSRKDLSPQHIWDDLDEYEVKVMSGLSRGETLDLEAALLWRATLLYRLACVERLKGFDFRIYGDRGWKELLSSDFIIRQPVNYYKELPLLYNASIVNFNATHMQMGQAVNQRVFDVPACGSFLLTDDQSGLYELFEPGKEVVTYRSVDEIEDLVTFYLNNRSERENIVARARKRILNEHTYKHRIETIIKAMTGRYA